MPIDKEQWSGLRGVNFGRWLSQSKLGEEHVKDFIKAGDVELVASWGLNHIRLPIDYPFLEDDDKPGEYKAKNLKVIDNFVGWCVRRKIHCLLDLHWAPGHHFMKGEENDLWHNAASLERFCNIWRHFAERYKEIKPSELAFDIMNEPVAKDAEDWNRVAGECLKAIREVDTNRVVVIGSNEWSNARTFPKLRVFDDENVVYTFHFYDPFLFTHQRAGWGGVTRFYQETVPYPGSPPNIENYKDTPHYDALKGHAGERYNKDFLLEMIKPVLEFQGAVSAAVYCGEFGVYSKAPRESQLRWLRDVMAIFCDNGIGYAYWTYNEPGFGVLDNNMQGVEYEKLPDGRHYDRELADILAGD